MRLKLTVLLLSGLLLNACGDKNAGSSGRTILAVRTLEDNSQFSNGDRMQVALLDATDIDSEEDAQRAVQNAQWISIDDFSDDNVVFREQDEEAPEFAGLTYAGHRHHRRHYRRPGRCFRSHRHGYRPPRGCWRPYFRDHWVNWRRPISHWGCRRGYLYRRGRCVLPYTPVYGYWWYPRHFYYTRVSVFWNNGGRRGRHHHHRPRRPRNRDRFRIGIYF